VIANLIAGKIAFLRQKSFIEAAMLWDCRRARSFSSTFLWAELPRSLS